jgi:hypothetical protein
MVISCGAGSNDQVEVERTGAALTVSQLTGIQNGFNESLMDSFMMFSCYGRFAGDCLSIPSGQSCPNTSTSVPREQRGLNTHEFFQLGGTRGANYQVTLSVNGIAEGKYYSGGTRAAGTGPIANPDDPNGVDTFYTGGAPVDVRNNNSFKIVVRNPPAAGAPLSSGTEVQHYYLNSFPPGTSTNFENHNTFPIHFVHTITVPGGGSIEYLLSDPNCHAVDNCGPGPYAGSCSTSRTIPHEATLTLPNTYMGQQLSTINVITGTRQPFHASILHLTVTAVSGP